MQATDKHASEEFSAMFSKVMESLRKDIEDVFGIMKARHRILRGRIALHKLGDINAVFFSCAIIHNMMLKDDGQFNAFSPSARVRRHAFAARPVLPLNNSTGWAARHLMDAFWSSRGTSEYGASNNVAVDESDDEAQDGDQVDYSSVRRGPTTRESEVDLVEERDASYHVLRAKLVENFEVQWRARAVEWLK
jgi:hypothetical protein